MGAIDEERAGVMILRAWVEPEHEHRLRVRLIQFRQGGSPAPVVRVFVSADEACAVIRAWLLDVQGCSEPPADR